jgi:hypothetical protein
MWLAAKQAPAIIAFAPFKWLCRRTISAVLKYRRCMIESGKEKEESRNFGCKNSWIYKRTAPTCSVSTISRPREPLRDLLRA